MAITKRTTLVIALILIGLFFRWLEPGKYAFGFDQIQILTNAISIKGGDITLVGPRTGPAEMFTGPLIYYLTALLLFIIPAPWVLVGTSLVIAGATGALLFYLAKRYLSDQIAIILLLLWTFSPFLILFDRVVWNPNLTLLASALVFFPLLHHLLGKKLVLLDLVFIGTGVFLGFQAHFSGLLLLPLLLILQLLWRRPHFASLFAGGVGLIATLAPTVLFDFRNNWLNLRGLERFLSNTDEVHSTLQLFRLQDSLGISISNLGHVVTSHLPNQFSLFVGGLLVSAVLIIVVQELFHRYRTTGKVTPVSKNSTIILTSFTWSILLAGALSFYSSTPPEYYFFVQLPALLLLISLLLTHVLPKISPSRLAAIALIGVIHSLSTFSLFSESSLFTIGNQLQLTSDLVQRNTQYPIAHVVYDMRPVDALGLQYFIDTQLQLQPQGEIIHLIGNAPQTERYNRLGVWVDPRTDPSKRYITEPDLVIATTQNVSLLRDYYRGNEFGSNRVYQVFTDGISTGETLVVVAKNTDPFDPASQTFKSFVEKTSPILGLKGWQWSNFNGIEGFAQHQEEFSLLFVPTTSGEITSEQLFAISATSIAPKPLF